MVKNRFLFILFFTAISVSQTGYSETSQHNITRPLFQGDLTEFVQGNINDKFLNPEDTVKSIVWVSCLVDTIGRTFNHYVALPGLSEEKDREAVRVARLIRYSQPAFKDGKPCFYRELIPVCFNLGINNAEDLARLDINYEEVAATMVSVIVYSEYPHPTDMKKNWNYEIHYPDRAFFDGVETIVFVSFTLNADASKSEYYVYNFSDYPDFNQEALRLVEQIAFSPAQREGPVRCRDVIMPIRFQRPQGNSRKYSNLKPPRIYSPSKSDEKYCRKHYDFYDFRHQIYHYESITPWISLPRIEMQRNNNQAECQEVVCSVIYDKYGVLRGVVFPAPNINNAEAAIAEFVMEQMSSCKTKRMNQTYIICY